MYYTICIALKQLLLTRQQPDCTVHIVQCTKAKFTNTKRNMCGAVNMVYLVYTVHLVYMVYMVCTVYKDKLVWRYVHGLKTSRSQFM